MPSQPASGGPSPAGRPAGPLATPPYSAAEWHLLTRLPGRVIVAAITADTDSPRRAVAHTLAGLEGVAAGRASDSDLVRAVAAAIYAEPDEEPPAPPKLANPDSGLAEMLDSCRAAVRLLSSHADPADSAAYRQWVQSIAARVCRASRPDRGGPWAGRQDGGSGSRAGDEMSVADRRLLNDLGQALGLA